MKKGFTLAEVLITLAIIGVVAALTIPAVVSNYQKQQFYTKFMKEYNVLSNALFLANADYGVIQNWNCSKDLSFDIEECIDTYFLAYVKNYQRDTLSNLYGSSEIKTLDGTSLGEISSGGLGFNTDAIILSDGAFIIPHYSVVSGDAHYIEFFIDTNGAKEPNTIGRDMFVLKYGSYKSAPKLFSEVDLFEEEDYVESCCNLSGDGECDIQGVACAERLIRDGKMDY